MITEPMKAPREPLLPEHFASLTFPVFASFKEDGVRCLTREPNNPKFCRCVPVSRSFKPIRNEYINASLRTFAPSGLDGELVVRGSNGIFLNFHDTQSAVMSVEGNPNYQFRVFDSFERYDMPFMFRIKDYKHAIRDIGDHSLVTFIEQIRCADADELFAFYQTALSLKKEGIVVRSLHGHYKQGRVTLKERIMFKVVDFQREEAVVVGWEPMMTNCNVATEDEFGRTKRSKHSSGLITQPLLGAWLAESPKWGRFNVSGFTAFQRDHFWRNRESFRSKTFTFKYKSHGSLDSPRHPIFLGFRSSDDL